MHACGPRDESAAEASLDVGFGFVAGGSCESSTVAHEGNVLTRQSWEEEDKSNCDFCEYL